MPRLSGHRRTLDVDADILPMRANPAYQGAGDDSHLRESSTDPQQAYASPDRYYTEVVHPPTQSHSSKDGLVDNPAYGAGRPGASPAGYPQGGAWAAPSARAAAYAPSATHVPPAGSGWTRPQWAIVGAVALLAVVALALALAGGSASSSDGAGTEAKLQELQSSVDMLAARSANTTDVAALRAQVDDLVTRLADAETRAAALEARLITAEANATALASALTAAQSSAGQAVADAAQASEDATSAALQMRALLGTVSLLMTQIDEGGATLPAAVASRVSALEAVAATRSAGDRFTIAPDFRRLFQVCPLFGPATLPDSADGLGLKRIADAGVAFQFGSAAEDQGSAVVLSESGIYVAGDTKGALFGTSANGDWDLFVARYNRTDGAYLWGFQAGTTMGERVFDVAVDDSAGGVFAVGRTQGSLFGSNPSGDYDVVAVRLAPLDGRVMWSKQYGTVSGDYARAVAVRANRVYVVGYTGGVLFEQSLGSTGSIDAFIMRLNSMTGEQEGGLQFGSSGDERASALALGVDSIFVFGYTNGPLYSSKPDTSVDDVFVVGVNLTSETEVWGVQFGSTGNDYSRSIAVSDTAVFVAGYTAGSLEGPSRGDSDAFVTCLNVTNGEKVWGKQFGGAASDTALGLAVSEGSVFVVGETSSVIHGSLQGLSDIVLTQLSAADGEVQWGMQLGSAEVDRASAVHVGSDGGVALTGVTTGAFAGPSRGETDVLLVSLRPNVTRCAPLVSGWAGV